MHELIMTNERLAGEMKKILELFPESVLIHSKDPDTQKVSFWTNDQFEKDISKVQNNINELDQILVKLDTGVNNIQQEAEYAVKNLSGLMKRHQQFIANEVDYK